MNQIAYEPRFGPIRLPEGFRQDMQGLPVEEQITCIMAVDASVHEMSYHMVDESICRSCYRSLKWDYYDPIVSDGVVVGVMNGSRVIMFYEYIFSASASDNNGAGYKERSTDYFLACVPRDLSRPVSLYPPFGAPEPVIAVPVTEVDYDVELPEEFLAQIKGKTVAQQLDYFCVACNERQAFCREAVEPLAYQPQWAAGNYPKTLCYDRNVQEIFVRNGVIAGVNWLATYSGSDRTGSIALRIGQRVEDDWTIRTFFLQPILYK